jgi:hypothetical protein
VHGKQLCANNLQESVGMARPAASNSAKHGQRLSPRRTLDPHDPVQRYAWLEHWHTDGPLTQAGHVHIWSYITQSIVKTFELTDVPVRAGRFVARKNWIVAGRPPRLWARGIPALTWLASRLRRLPAARIQLQHLGEGDVVRGPPRLHSSYCCPPDAALRFDSQCGYTRRPCVGAG